MTISHTVFLICIGFGYYIGNVLSDELDLSNALDSGFAIKRSDKNSAIYTEFKPFGGKKITRVVKGSNLVWEARSGESSKCVTQLSSSNTPECLLFIEIIEGELYSVKYYATLSGIYHEISNVDYNLKLSQMAKLPALNNPGSGFSHQNDVFAAGYGRSDDNYSSALSNLSEDDDEPKVTYSFKGKQQESFERKIKSNGFAELDHNTVLDITTPGSNPRVDFEYEIRDGIPILIVKVKKGKVKVVREKENPVWKSTEGDGLSELTAYSQYAVFKLVEIIFHVERNLAIVYYRKEGSTWKEVPLIEAEECLREIKSKILITDEIDIDLSNVDSDKYYSKYEQSPVFDATTYFPLTGYLLTQVRDGNTVIWKSSTRRCIAAIVVKKSKQIMYLKLEILNKHDKAKNKFFKKVQGRYYKIKKETFETLINPENSQAHQSADVSNIQDSEFEVEESNHRVDDSNEYDPDELIQLEILKQDHTCVSEDEYKGVKYRTFVPDEGQAFYVVSLNSSVIWKAESDQFTDFVRMFYPGGCPTHCLIKLTDSDFSEEDIYFILRNGVWVQVNSNQFIEDFNSHIEPANSRRSNAT